MRATLITVVDDATSALLYAQLWPQETTLAVLSALAQVLRTEGLPMALYTDRASWAFVTPKATGPVDKTRLTQVGRALQQLGIEHIPSYSPQARGRSERMNRTLQGRLVNEFRVAKIRSVAAANRYLTAACPSTTPRFAGRPSTAQRPSSPAAGWIWIRFSVSRTSA